MQFFEFIRAYNFFVLFLKECIAFKRASFYMKEVSIFLEWYGIILKVKIVIKGICIRYSFCFEVFLWSNLSWLFKFLISGRIKSHLSKPSTRQYQTFCLLINLLFLISHVCFWIIYCTIFLNYFFVTTLFILFYNRATYFLVPFKGILAFRNCLFGILNKN